MAVEIVKISDDVYKVNGKHVYKDMNEKWIGSNLSQTECNMFNKYIAATHP